MTYKNNASDLLADDPHASESHRLELQQAEGKPIQSPTVATTIEQYQQFIANSAEGIWRFDTEIPVPTHWSEDAQLDGFYEYGYLSECNNAFAQMYGLESGSDLIGARLPDMLPREKPENEAYLRAFIQANYRLTNVESVEADKNSNPKYFANSIVGVIENGALVRAWGTQRDITAQRKAEQELAQRERDYAALVDNAPDVLARFGQDLRFLYINVQGVRNTGVERTQFLGRTFREAAPFPPHLISLWEEALKRVFASGQGETIEYEFPTPAGTGWFECVLVPELSGESSSKVETVVTITRDITVRHKAAQIVEASEARYRALVDATSQIVWTSGPDGTFVSEQPSWAAYTGQTFDQYKAGGAIEAVHPRDAQASYNSWFDAIANRTAFQMEHRLRRYDGVYRTFLVRAVPVFGANGVVREWVGTHTDITEQREIEAKQRRFLRDIVYSMTEGRLRLCDNVADLPAPLSSAWNDEETPVALSHPNLRLLRQRIKAVAQSVGFDDERTYELMTGAHEAAMNAVVHAGGGEASVYKSADGETVQVWVRDTGRGISDESLPRALEKGASTAGTLGHGFWLMLRGCDRLWLLTGEGGTTVVLEQDQTPPLPAWLQGTESKVGV